jgi:hypothetical protein
MAHHETSGSTMREWVGKACGELLRLRNGSGVWGYRTDRGPSVEATTLTCLGLLSCRQGTPTERVLQAARRGAEWLAAMQGHDGSLGVSPTLPRPGWATPYAILLWGALETHSKERQRAITWLLDQKGMSLPVVDFTQSIIGHDPTLVGWPWINGTHSWLEPTALAVLALGRECWREHPRVAEGIALITDRALPHGGWNYGNKSVFSHELRPQPGPTGLALLALATRRGKVRPRAVDRAIAYLRQTLVDVRAPISLAWGVLGLRAWDAAPPDTEKWLNRSYASFTGRRDSAVGLGLLLLASAEDAPAFFGARAVSPDSPQRIGTLQPFTPRDSQA